MTIKRLLTISDTPKTFTFTATLPNFEQAQKAGSALIGNRYGVKNSAEMMKDHVEPQINIDMEKARNKQDWFTYYTLYKQRCIENEQEWGYQGVHFVSGIEVHDERFVELMLEIIDE